MHPRAQAFHNKKSLHNGKLCATVKSSPHWLQLEKASTKQQRPRAARNKLHIHIYNIICIMYLYTHTHYLVPITTTWVDTLLGLISRVDTEAEGS